MIKALIFMGGMIAGGAIAIVILCCVMINGCSRPVKEVKPSIETNIK